MEAENTNERKNPVFSTIAFKLKVIVGRFQLFDMPAPQAAQGERTLH